MDQQRRQLGASGGVKTLRVDHGINRAENKVYTVFSEHVNNLSATPAQAVETAVKMLECAMFLDPDSVKDITWPTKGKVKGPGEQAT